MSTGWVGHGSAQELRTAAGQSLARLDHGHELAAIDSPRPFLHPLSTPAGRVVSEARPDDHRWHFGLSLAVANIAVAGEADPVNHWGGVTWSGNGYVQLENNGRQRVTAVETTGDTVSSELEWMTQAGRTFLVEKRVLTARDGAGYWRLDWASHWSNESGRELGFGSPTTAGRENAGYGGLFLRGAPTLVGADVVLEGSGQVADAMGATAGWAALRTGDMTVAIAAHPGNPVNPAPWFVRVEPVAMLCAAPFFFDEWVLATAATAEWRWSMIIADGGLGDAEIAAAFA